MAYLEGWFVEPSHRGRGIGAALLSGAEERARESGCTEFASDTEIDNTAAAEAHRALGFVEAERVVCFRKTL